MGFSGYWEILCPRGHLETVDVYDCDSNPWEYDCGWCKQKSVWFRLVDTTNGSPEFDLVLQEEMKFKPLEIEKEAILTTCPHCGNSKCIEPTRYRIPKGEKG